MPSAIITRSKMDAPDQHDIISLNTEQPFWERVYLVSPLVVVGTRDGKGSYNLTPKHSATPMGGGNYFGFVCPSRHETYCNVRDAGDFTVSYPRPSQVPQASLAASPHSSNLKGTRGRPTFDQVPTWPAKEVDGVFLEGAYLFLECTLDRRVDDLDQDSLLIGEVQAIHVHKDALRVSEQDDQEAVREHPLLAYIPPDRYATITETTTFPFPAGMRK